MFKRILGGTLAAVMLLTQVPVSAYAAEIGTTEIAQEVVETSEATETTETQESEVVEETTETQESEVVEETTETQVNETFEVPVTEETVSVEVETFNEGVQPRYTAEEAGLRTDVTRTLQVEAVDNFINFKAIFEGYSGYYDFNNENAEYKIKISTDPEFSNSEEWEYVYFSSYYSIDGNTFVYCGNSCYIGEPNTTYYAKLAAYSYSTRMEAEFDTIEVTTGEERVITTTFDVEEPTSNWICYNFRLEGLNDYTEQSSYENYGYYYLYYSEYEDFSDYQSSSVRLSRLDEAEEFILVTEDAMIKAKANTTYYLKLVWCTYNTNERIDIATATVTTKDEKVYTGSIEVEEPENNTVNYTVSLSGYDNYSEYNNEDFYIYVDISETEDFAEYSRNSVYFWQEDGEEGEEYILSKGFEFEGEPNTTYYLRLVNYHYSTGVDGVSHLYDTASVTTKEAKSYRGILEADEPNYNVVNLDAFMYNFEDWDEFWNCGMSFELQVSEDAEFSTYDTLYLDWDRDYYASDFVLKCEDYTYTGNPNTTYYFRLVGTSYDQEDIVYDTIQVTTKEAKSFVADLTVEEPTYNFINYGATLTGFDSWEDFEEFGSSFAVTIATDENLKDIVKEQYISWSAENQNGAFKLFWDYSFEGEANTTYYMQLGAWIQGEWHDYETVSVTTKEELVITRTFEAVEPTNNIVTVNLTLVGYEDWKQFNNLNHDYFVYIYDNPEFSGYDYETVYFDWSSRTIDGVFTLIGTASRAMEANTTYYLKFAGYDNNSYSNIEYGTAVVTTKEDRQIERTFEVAEPGFNLIEYSASLVGYDNWTDYYNARVSYYVDISKTECFSAYDRQYVNWQSSNVNGVFKLKANASIYAEANTSYYVRFVCYDNNKYTETVYASTFVTTKDEIVFDTSLALSAVGAGSASFLVNSNGVNREVLNDNIYLQYGTDSEFQYYETRGFWLNSNEENDANTYSIKSTVTYLNPETAYYARLVFEIGNGEYRAISDVVSFTTEANVAYSEEDIPDDALRAKILENAEVLDKVNLERVSNLYIGRESNTEAAITDLTGISLLTNLSSLELDYHRVTDISVLVELPNLEYCSVIDNKISTIPDLSGLTYLETLNLRFNRIPKTEFVTTNTNIPVQLRTNTYWLAENKESQRSSEEVGITLADTYYSYGDGFALQVEINNTYQLDRYTLSVYEGDTLLVDKAEPYDTYSWYNVADWLLPNLITTAGVHELTFVVYANDNETIRCTKSINFSTESFYMEDEPMTISTYKNYLYMYFNIYNEESEVTDVTLQAADGSKVYVLGQEYSDYYDYDQRYEDIFKYSLIETEGYRYGYRLETAANIPVGNYHLVITLADGDVITRNNAVIVSDAPLLERFSDGDYSKNVDSDVQYIQVSGYNLDWSRICPVIYDTDGNALTSLLSYKITGTTSAVYKLMKAEGVSWSNYVINGMTIKLLNNTGSAILNEDMTSRFFISEYPNVYYADYDWKNGIMVFLCDNLENGVNYSWELWSGDYEDKIIAATAQAVVNNGRANLAFKDLSGNAYDFLNSDRNSFYVSIYNGDECVCNSQYIYLRMNDVDTLEEEYSKTIDYYMYLHSMDSTTIREEYYLSSSIFSASPVLSTTLSDAEGQVIATGTAAATALETCTKLEVVFENVNLTVDTEYFLEVKDGDKSLGIATVRTYDPAGMYYTDYSYNRSDDDRTLGLALAGLFPMDSIDVSKLSLILENEDGDMVDQCSIKGDSVYFDSEEDILEMLVEFTEEEYEYLRTNYRYLYFKLYYNNALVKYVYSSDYADNSIYFGEYTKTITGFTTSWKTYGDYSVRQTIGVWSKPNAQVKVLVYLPYDAEPLKTFTVTTDENGRYRFAASDLSGLQINENCQRYDVVLLDAEGNFASYTSKIYLYGTGEAGGGNETPKPAIIYDPSYDTLVYMVGNQIDTSMTGIAYYDEAAMYLYFTNGVWDQNMFGFAEFGGGQFLIVNGSIATNISGVQLVGDSFYFLSNGQLQSQYTGLALYDGQWFYVVNGILQINFNGMQTHDGALFLIAAGRIVNDYVGLYGDNATGNWYYIVNGQVQSQYTGLAMHDGHWFYLVNGMLAGNYTGTVEWNGAIFNVANGMVV